MATLDSNSFDTFFPQWQKQLMYTGALSLATVSFVRPDGLLLLFLGLIFLLQEWPYFRLRVPANSDVRSYLVRAGFFSALPEDVIVEPRLSDDELFRAARFNGSAASLLELSIAKTSQDVEHLANKVVDATQQFLGCANNVACDFGILVSEIWQNAIHHGKGNYSAGVMQVYRRDSNYELQLAIGDDGVGIATSLRDNTKYHDITNDQDAIETAVMPGVSSISELLDSTRGYGLARVIKKMKEESGILNIRSGSAKYRYLGERNAHVNHRVPDLPGTQVVVSLAAAA